MIKLKSLFLIGFAIFFSNYSYSQSGSDLLERLSELISNINKNDKRITEIAKDKEYPDNATNLSKYGYQYTRTKGFEIPLSDPLHRELDEVFLYAYKNGYLNSKDASTKYQKDIESELLSVETKGIQVFYVQLPKSIERDTLKIVDILVMKKIIVTKPRATGGRRGRVTDEEEEGPEREELSTWFSLSGKKLRILFDKFALENKLKTIYDQREKDVNNISPYFPFQKRGPFIVSDTIGLKKFSNVFVNSPDFSIQASSVRGMRLNRPTNVNQNIVGISNPSAQLADANVEKSFKINFQERGIPVRIDDVTITRDPGIWKLKGEYKGKTVDSNNPQVQIEVIYKQPNTNTENITDVNIKYTVLSSPPEEVISTVQLGAKTKEVPPKAFIDFSIGYLAGTLWLKNEWNVSVRTGNMEIGHPYWSTGNTSLLFGYKNAVKFGIVMPTNLFGEGFDIGPLVTPKRKLHGAWGIAAEFNLQTTFIKSINDAFALGGYIFYSKLSQGSEYSTKPINHDSDLFYIPLIAQIYYPVIFQDDLYNPKNIFQIKAGVSYHQIKRAHINRTKDANTYYMDHYATKDDVGKLSDIKVEKKIPSPLLIIDYVNMNESHPFGFGVQYINNIVSFNGFLDKVLWDWLRIEATYTQPLRDAEEWENSSFFWFSPRIQLPI